MNTIKIITTQNIELEYDLANVGERLLAWLIDAAIFTVYFIIILIIINIFSDSTGHNEVNNPWPQITISILVSIPFVLYNLACDVGLNGQTFGKKLMRIKVISLNGDQASFGQYLTRWLFRLVDIFIFNGLPAFVSIIVSDKKQRIGDLVAGTTVIRLRSRAALQQTIYVPTDQPAYEVSFPEIVRFSDGDMQLVREVINRVNQTGNILLAQQTAEKIKQTLQIQTEMEAFYFLQVLMADYNYLTSQSK
jgi:uncharacterized RDD family membrane protein YckC